MKHIDIKFKFIYNVISKNIKMKYAFIDAKIVYMFAKALPKTKFQ